MSTPAPDLDVSVVLPEVRLIRFARNRGSGSARKELTAGSM